MASNRKYKWDKLSVETDDDYADFLFFRNCGPNRSLRNAYKRYYREHIAPQNAASNYAPPPPDRWQRLSRENRWRERASAWDVHNLKSLGCQLVVNQSRSLLILSRKALAASAKVAISTDDARELLEVLKAVQAYLTPEFVSATGQAAAPEVVESKAVVESVE